MKKALFIALTIISIASCTKKEEAPKTVEAEKKVMATDSLATATTSTLKEMDATQISELLAPKKNDTIYVTNFFATWCGQCMREIPHFKEKMEELKNEKVKFTFVSVDKKDDWATKVNDFGAEQNLTNHIVLLDAEKMGPDFFTKHFKTWTGESIPFTLITKGDKRDETIGMMSKFDLDNKIKALK